MKRLKIISQLILLLMFNFGVAGHLAAEDYYWVGGPGVWSDINHWATTSGGTVLHSQVPTANDDVYFDENSFTDDGQIVHINLKNAVCRDLNWINVTRNPVLEGEDTTNIRIFGSLYLSANMMLDYEGQVKFEAQSGQHSVLLAGHTIINNVWFEGIGGSWKLEDDFMCNAVVYFTNGTLNTNNKKFHAYEFSSMTQTNRTLLLGQSLIEVVGWQIDAVNLQMEAMGADFQIETFMGNYHGGTVSYPDVHILHQGSITNDSIRVSFHDVFFEDDGDLMGDCNLHDLYFDGTGNVTGTDTIHFAVFNQGGSLNGGHCKVEKIVFASSGLVKGFNDIEKIISNGTLSIRSANTIDSAFCNRGASVDSANNINYFRVVHHSYITGQNSFQTADLIGDGYIRGNNNFHDLMFHEGYSYSLGINSTQTITGRWYLDGSCRAPIRIFSDTLGVQSVVNATGANVTGRYLSLRDLKAIGNTPFTVHHSVDLGGNEGWNIETTGGRNLYWVNGTGDWTDNNHWSAQSGGPGGECCPTEIDNVFFDSNSFNGGSAVTLDAENAVCKDMTWEDGIPSVVFGGSDTNNLHIFGSLTETGALTWQIQGTLFFESSTPGETITTALNPFQRAVVFSGRGGSWYFEDDFTTLSEIHLWHGAVFTKGNKVLCANFRSDDTTTRGLNLSTTTWTMTGVHPVAVWLLNGANLTLHADSSFIISAVSLGHVLNFGGGRPMVFNNVTFTQNNAYLINSGVYCYYNVVKNYGVFGDIHGDCTIDSALFYDMNSTIYDNDSINVAIFHEKNGRIKGGNHRVKYALFMKDGKIEGHNIIDTAIFMRNAYITDTNSIDTLSVHNRAFIQGINSVRTALLLGPGQFYGTNDFHDLTITKSFNYYLEAGKTQTVYDNLNANGTCTGPIFIQSTENRVQAVINKVNGTVEVDYVQLRDIKAEGSGIPFKAYNSVDLGNNTNWNIYVSSPKELYWVNGKGMWSDSLHWSESSGGPGGYCVPTPIDNVYFDQNSFLDEGDSVIIDIGNATCHNMDWTGSLFHPFFYSPDTNYLRIYGGLKLAPNMIMNLFGTLFFESTHNNNHILNRGVGFLNNIVFQGIGGEWQLDDGFYSIDSVMLVHGELNTNGKDFFVGKFVSYNLNDRSFVCDGSHIILRKDGTEVWLLNGLNLNFSAENAFFEISGVNSIFRTDYGGPFRYPYIQFDHNGRIYNKTAQVSIDSVYFLQGGQIHGDCDIDVVRGFGITGVYDSDNINYIVVDSGELIVQGGSHNIKTMIALNTGSVIGNNTIDSAVIAERGILSGNNNITKYIEFQSDATVSGNNNVHYALLKGNGTISGENVFDRLKFTPGNIYELEENKTQTVNLDFLIRGNNCFPITLRSQQAGVQANVSMPSGRIVSGDFIEIKDINATGGATYYAGRYSTDLSDNSGWIFDNAPGYIFGFNDDTVVCSGDPMIITTDNFNPDDMSTFLWHDGSTNPWFQLSGEDTVWVTVNYADNCSYTDTLAIHYRNSPELELGDDKTVCSGDTIDIVYHSDSIVSYFWSTGDTDTVTTASTPGYYTLTVTNAGGCSATDSIYVNAIPSPEVDLGPDTTIFSDQIYLLDAGNQGAQYIWSTGDTVQTITVNSEGDYWVSVSQNGCTGYDTVSVFIYPDCILAVPNAFSPNGDGHNDILYARGEGFVEMELMIFNRLGELVFQTKDNSIGWDGTYKGKPQPVDAYAYILKGLCVSGRSVMKKGNITLLR